LAGETLRVGYVLKRYPRYSETFIVNEILAHEKAGLDVEIFALHHPNETALPGPSSEVRAAVSYLGPPNYPEPLSAHDFWVALRDASDHLPDVWAFLPEARPERARHVYQALLLAVQARAKKLSLLHAHFATSATNVARLAARFAGLPFTFTCHAKDIFHESVRADDLRQKLSDAAAAVTVSDYNVEHLRRTLGPAADRVRRIYNGLDLSEFS